MPPKGPSGDELRQCREQNQLTQAQLAALVHVNVLRNPSGGMQSSTVQGWERSGGMPESTWELLQAKLLLLREGACSFRELLETPLHVLVEKILRKRKKTTPKP